MNVPFKIRGTVRVKLTRATIEYYDVRQRMSCEGYPALLRTRQKIVEDAEGWSEWSLWSLMGNFGHLMSSMNHPPPFCDEIEFVVEP